MIKKEKLSIRKNREFRSSDDITRLNIHNHSSLNGLVIASLDDKEGFSPIVGRTFSNGNIFFFDLYRNISYDIENVSKPKYGVLFVDGERIFGKIFNTSSSVCQEVHMNETEPIEDDMDYNFKLHDFFRNFVFKGHIKESSARRAYQMEVYRYDEDTGLFIGGASNRNSCSALIGKVEVVNKGLCNVLINRFNKPYFEDEDVPDVSFSILTLCGGSVSLKGQLQRKTYSGECAYPFDFEAERLPGGIEDYFVDSSDLRL